MNFRAGRPALPTDAATEGAPIRSARRLCFFAHYHPTGVVADYVLHYLAELRKAGFATVVASTTTFAEGEAEKLRSACDDLILRQNQGLDFGSWIDCWRKWSPIEAELLLLCNDSVYGPIDDLTDCIDRLCSTPADFYGLVGSHELRYHVQSWFVLLRPAAYRSSAFEGLMSNPVPVDLSKFEIIQRYEVGMTAALREQGLQGHCLYEPSHDAYISRMMPFNASHLLWKELVTEFGIPFIKVDLLRDNPLFVENIDGWSEIVAGSRPQLISSISADVEARSRVAGRRSERKRGVGRALRLIYQRWVRRCLVRDLRYLRSGSSVALRLNLLYFAVGRFAGHTAKKFAQLLGLATKV